MSPLPLLLLAVAGLQAPAPGNPGEARILATVEAYHRAFEQRDLEALRPLFDPDLLVFEAGGIDRGRDTYLGHHLGPELKELSTWRTSGMAMRAHVHGDLAYVTCAFTYEAAFSSGKTARGQATETLVLASAKGSWVIRHLHWSSRPLKAVKP
jgi:ketosteroid isomerase-like protein